MKISRHNGSSSKEPIIKRDPSVKHRFQPKTISLKKKRLELLRQRIGKPFDRSERKSVNGGSDSGKATGKELTANFKNDWWIHVWSGLVLDESAKHYRAMHSAVWLYLFLLLVANRRNGMLFRKISTIEKETGFNRRSIGRWLKILRDNGYIKTYSTGRFLQIVILKWRPIINRQRVGGLRK